MEINKSGSSQGIIVDSDFEVFGNVQNLYFFFQCDLDSKYCKKSLCRKLLKTVHTVSSWYPVVQIRQCVSVASRYKGQRWTDKGGIQGVIQEGSSKLDLDPL